MRSQYLHFLKNKTFIAVKCILFTISVNQTLKFLYSFLIFGNKFSMLYNFPLFSFKSAFCSKFTASLSLIPLIIQRLSAQ